MQREFRTTDVFRLTLLVATALVATAVPMSATTIEYESVDLPDATRGAICGNTTTT